MKNSPDLTTTRALRALLQHQDACEALPPPPRPVPPACYWVTYLVGHASDLDQDRGYASNSGFLVVRADGPLEAEAQAELLLAERGDQLGLEYTVTAVHEPAQLIEALFQLHASESGLVAPPQDGDLDSWEDALAVARAQFLGEGPRY